MLIVDTQSTGELDLSRVPSYPQSCCFKYTGQLRIHTAHVNHGYTVNWITAACLLGLGWCQTFWKL